MKEPSECYPHLPAESEGAREARFIALLEPEAPRIMVWARIKAKQFLHQTIDPEDMLQETAMRAWKSFEKYRGEQGSFRAWLAGIAAKVLLEWARKVHRMPRPPGTPITPSAVPESVSGISKRVARAEGLTLLAEWLDRNLDDVDHELICSRLQGVPLRHAAERLNMNYGSARNRVSRIYRDLRGGSSRELRAVHRALFGVV